MGDVLALRLLMLTQDFPPVVGGIQTYTGCLARLWSEWCDDFAVMAPAHPEDAAWDKQHGFDIFRENTSSDLFRIRIDRALNRLLRNVILMRSLRVIGTLLERRSQHVNVVGMDKYLLPLMLRSLSKTSFLAVLNGHMQSIDGTFARTWMDSIP